MRIEVLQQLKPSEKEEAEMLLPKLIRELKSSTLKDGIQFSQEYRIDLDSNTQEYCFTHKDTEESLPKVISSSLPVLVTLQMSAVENFSQE
jgi:hypothetical protein